MLRRGAVEVGALFAKAIAFAQRRVRVLTLMTLRQEEVHAGEAQLPPPLR